MFGILPCCRSSDWPHAEYLALGPNNQARSKAYRALFTAELDHELVSEIRRAADVGLALGNDRFMQKLERLTGQRQRLLKCGPKPKPAPNPKEEIYFDPKYLEDEFLP